METEKTSLIATGIVWAKNLFVNKENKQFHSVDLLIANHKNMVNVRLPEGYDQSQLKEGTLVRIPVAYQVTKYGATLNAV